jgi:hypothetical protein
VLEVLTLTREKGAEYKREKRKQNTQRSHHAGLLAALSIAWQAKKTQHSALRLAP